MSKFTVLLIDDEEELVENIKEVLSIEGWDVVGTSDAEKALCYIDQHKFNVIVSDISMPKHDGIHILRHLRRTDKTSTFIIMSAFMQAPVWEIYDLGADSFIGKPFNISELIERIRWLQIPCIERWHDQNQGRNQLKLSGHIELDSNVSCENFSLGRGGMFISPEFSSTQRGDLMSFRIHTGKLSIEGTGKVLWNRRTKAGDLLPGLGIEFLSLKDNCREIVANAIARSQERAYVPQGRLKVKV